MAYLGKNLMTSKKIVQKANIYLMMCLLDLSFVVIGMLIMSLSGKDEWIGTFLFIGGLVNLIKHLFIKYT